MPHQRFIDWLHAVRFAAQLLLETNVMGSTVEDQAAALSALFETAMDLMGFSGIEDPETKEDFEHFFAKLAEKRQMVITEGQPLANHITSMEAVLWALGKGNDRDETYNQAADVATVLVSLVDEMLTVYGEVKVEAEPVRPARTGKPSLSVVAEK